jgi:hypothetical protein
MFERRRQDLDAKRGSTSGVERSLVELVGRGGKVVEWIRRTIGRCQQQRALTPSVAVRPAGDGNLVECARARRVDRQPPPGEGKPSCAGAT